ncbi:RICIN domain-containing protein [Moorena sp. SIO3I6]|uniref:RICIN domain-containing protein n=1 Tax=Moorena sp. SIO3I6 TaxID=2607831 RepID=UPI0013C784AB|nr:RICIN domain-containing protein [Moorena sp. SIO3I6]NEO94642.1 RICIN domain-containing protein [Moorena sp. SIO3G5]NEP23638.1 RICIN domain-containing protein [Moorena sp. SIO3I6]
MKSILENVSIAFLVAVSSLLIWCPNPAMAIGTTCMDLSGEYRIQVVADNSYLHENGLGDKLVSTRYQPNDDYTKFILTERLGDSSYRIQVKADNRYLHEDGLGDKLVSTRYQPNDDYTRFYFDKNDDDTFRIRVKADNSYLHEDGLGDKLVSTRYQPNDDYTRFYLWKKVN